MRHDDAPTAPASHPPSADRCEQALDELIREEPSSALAWVREEEGRMAPPSPGAADGGRGYTESMLRVYRYASSFQLKPDDGHHECAAARARARAALPHTPMGSIAVSYTHLRAHETLMNL
eukprot:3063741-Prymnesium_polylepis.1